MVELFRVPPSRLLYRLVGEAEYQRVIDAWKQARANQAKDPAYVAGCATQLEKDLELCLSGVGVGNDIHEHTMTAQGGGQIGGAQSFVSMFTDFYALSRSTDDRVQVIVRNAEYVLTFSVPKTAAFDAPSDLSELETEVLVPNNLKALAAMLIDHYPNKYRVVDGHRRP